MGISELRSVNNNVIWVKRSNDSLMEHCAAECRKRGDRIGHAETGPVLLHRLVGAMGLAQWVVDPGVFNPIHYRDLRIIMKDYIYFLTVKNSRIVRGLRPILLSTGTKALHLYAASFLKQFPIVDEHEIPHRTVLSESFAPTVPSKYLERTQVNCTFLY